MSTTISVFACDPQPIVVEGLRGVLTPTEGFRYSGSVANLGDAAEMIRRVDPDVILIDYSYGMDAIGGMLAELDGARSRPVILWVMEFGDSECFRALQLGIRGILRKTLGIPSLFDCLRTVHRGTIWIEEATPPATVGAHGRVARPRVTPREQDIIACVCQGMKNREIADELDITPGTVKVHLTHIFEKTGVKDRRELASCGRNFLRHKTAASGL